MCSYCNSCFFKKDCCYRNNCGIWLHDGDWEHCLIKEKNRCLHVLLPIYMFWYSRFSFRNLKDANSCMFSWCITTSRLLICSWHDMTFIQFLQWMYSIYSKSLLFASISYVQVKRSQSWIKVLFFIGGFPLNYNIIWF